MPHTGHVYVAVSGYGKRVVPVATPFEFGRAEDDALVATATWGHSPQHRRIATDASSDRGMTNPVATVVDGPERREWWLDTAGVYSVPFPPGWTAIVSGEVSPAFYLVREPDRAIFVQTARNRPALEDLPAPGQTVAGRRRRGRRLGRAVVRSRGSPVATTTRAPAHRRSRGDHRPEYGRGLRPRSRDTA